MLVGHVLVLLSSCNNLFFVFFLTITNQNNSALVCSWCLGLGLGLGLFILEAEYALVREIFFSNQNYSHPSEL